MMLDLTEQVLVAAGITAFCYLIGSCCYIAGAVRAVPLGGWRPLQFLKLVRMSLVWPYDVFVSIGWRRHRGDSMINTCTLLTCRPLVKIFVAKKRVFRKSPDDKPFRLCVGMPNGTAMEIERYSTCRAAVNARKVVLDWFDSDNGQACYQESLKMLLGGYQLRKGQE